MKNTAKPNKRKKWRTAITSHLSLHIIAGTIPEIRQIEQHQSIFLTAQLYKLCKWRNLFNNKTIHKPPFDKGVLKEMAQ